MPLLNTVVVPFVTSAVDDEGEPLTARRGERVSLDVMLDDLAWWSQALQAARGALSIAAAGLGMLGAAAIIVTRKDLRSIDTVRLTTTTDRPLLRELVAAYARCVRDSTNTVATQITLFRDAVWLVLLGAVAYGVAWLIAL